jgi:hypothetical protein
MKFSILSIFILLLTSSCEKKIESMNTSSTPSDSLTIKTHKPIESSVVQTCFMGTNSKDSVFISLENNLGTIIGKLWYKNFEKDNSFGDVIGNKNGDTLKLNYTFQSEGKTSEREIFFIYKDGNLIEGIGDYKEDGNRSFYSDDRKIKYSGGITLNPVDCKNFDKKFNSK